jgi:ACR3 family arsenite efflux pump ArsB
VAYAILAPLIGWFVARNLRLEPSAIRVVSFSAATRNSLVVLPLAFAVPGGVPMLPAVIVTQTIIELVSKLLYVRWRLSMRLSR